MRRSNIWKEWIKHNAWMAFDEEYEIGIVIELILDADYYDSKPVEREDQQYAARVFWSTTGESYDSLEDLEIISRINNE